MGEPIEPEDESLALAETNSRRAAVALEDAGELRAAARLFEYVGEHAQAAALRLEHAATVDSAAEKVAILREGAARIGGTTPEGRELHLVLARSLVQRAAAMDPGAARRALVLEAAQSYETGDEGARAGQIYERLGLLRRAERAYRDAGALEDYERILEVLESREQAAEDLRTLTGAVDEALREGRRLQAHRLMRDHVAERHAEGKAPEAHLARELAELEARVPRQSRLELGYEAATLRGRVRYVLSPRLRIGRAPGSDLCVQGGAVSRHHLRLSLGQDEGGEPTLVAEDLGSKAGSFYDGEALPPGIPTPLAWAGQLAVGIAATWEWRPSPPSKQPWAMLGPLDDDPTRWLCFAPDGAPLVLHGDRPLGATLQAAGDFVALSADEYTSVELAGRALGSGARVELIRGDRLILDGPGGRVRLEVSVS